MRKRVIVGDMHGMFGIVKDIYDLEQPDDFIILGDYFDSFTIAPNLQELAYKDLLELRRYHKSLHKGKFIMRHILHIQYHPNDIRGRVYHHIFLDSHHS